MYDGHKNQEGMVEQARNSSSLETLAEQFQFPDQTGLCRIDRERVGEENGRRNGGQQRSEQEVICEQKIAQARVWEREEDRGWLGRL